MMLAELTSVSHLVIPSFIATFALCGCENHDAVVSEMSVSQKIAMACPRDDKSEILVFARNTNSRGRDAAHYSPGHDISLEEMTSLQASLGDGFCAEMDDRRLKNFNRVLDDGFAKSRNAKKG
jgi:hypothetical protein